MAVFVEPSDLIMERLRLNALDMGVQSAFKTAPRRVLEREAYVCAYTLMGGLFSPTVNSRGVLKIARTYIQRFLVYPLGLGEDDIEEGAESNIRALPWIDRPHIYYAERPQLQIAKDSESTPGGLSELAGVESVVASNDPIGLTLRPAPGGTQCAAFDVQLNIIFAVRLAPVASPYSS